MGALNVLLRPDAHYAPVDGGVFFVSHQGETFIAGASVHQWLDRLAPLLDGSRTMDQLTANLPAERAEFVTRLVGTLRARGLVRDVGPVEPDSLTDGEREEHSALLSFIGYFRDSPGKVFEDVRDIPTTITGSGPLVAELRRACAAAGLRAVGDHAAPAVVIHAAERAEPERAAELERRCADSGIVLAQVMPAANGIWWQPASRRGGWSAAWRRHRALVPAAPADGPLSPVAVRVVANQLAHDLFRLLSGLREDTGPRLVVLDPQTLASSTHPVIGYPERAGAAALDPRTAPALTEEEFSRRAKTVMDSTTGLFAEIDEGDLAQLPLHVTTTTVATRTGPQVVTGAGLTFEQARYRCALAAFARAASGEPGAAAGYSWEEAVTTGALAHAAARTLAERLTAPAGRVELDRVPGIEYFLAMIGALGEELVVHDVTGSLGVPVVVGALSGGATASGAGLTRAAAVVACLRDLLLIRQAEINDQPVYAPAGCAPVALPGERLAPEPPAVTADEVLRRLGAHVVALDHDQAVSEVMPFVVEVVVP
ncbi:YcaO-like family protein [Lentzea sp. NEAU-D7]|uniref:YcaO-like family protein n=1 Tax=Lentzea sp. NEAU-D7 TaxID=2994667 RepID=UPI00224A9E57|nr:YcaO-like family protein [Lentzea sp. NEAU-D7]MCX2951554.1 YcaO-like family protein [Lentzea sp. NEAU-D7]